jgi:hypothetical protein
MTPFVSSPLPSRVYLQPFGGVTEGFEQPCVYQPGEIICSGNVEMDVNLIVGFFPAFKCVPWIQEYKIPVATPQVYF